MPEVKPWLATELYPDDNDESIGIAGNFKVLTLDQIEEWLAQELELSILNGEEGYVSMLSLLAQVQAMKEKA